MRTNQSGFTIIELIVVIALLGILSAVALPRFINVTAQAHDAAVEGAGAGFATGVALLKAQVVANGQLGNENADDIAGYGEEEELDVNENGFPVGTEQNSADPNPLSVGSVAECINIWTGLFQGGAATASSGTGSDYQATNPSSTCLYTYQQDTGTTRTIEYVASTGAVSVTIP